MKLGIICNDWKFFRNKYDVLKSHYDTKTLGLPKTKISIERYKNFLYKRNLQRLMLWSDITFFEFANKPLVVASHLKKVSKIVVRLHRYELFSWADQIDWKKVDKIILVSTAMKKRFIDKYPYMKDRATVIYNDIDTEKFIPKNTNLNRSIGIAGDILPLKRVYELILAFYELQKELPDLKLRICGSSRYNNVYPVVIKELVKKLELEDKVFFEGNFETKDKLIDWYNTIDILICNSYIESFHLTSKEAMACERYALSHFWDGAEEFFEEDQMYTTNSDLIDKIKGYYLLDSKTREQLIRRLRNKIIDMYDSKKQAKKLVTLIKDL